MESKDTKLLITILVVVISLVGMLFLSVVKATTGDRSSGNANDSETIVWEDMQETAEEFEESDEKTTTKNANDENISESETSNKLESETDISNQVGLLVNKVQVFSVKGTFYLGAKKVVMIPEDVVEENLQCSCVSNDDGTITVSRGKKVITLRTGSDKILINHAEYILDNKVEMTKGVVYYPASLFSGYFNYDYKWDDNKNKGVISDKKTEDPLPKKYDYRKVHRAPKVKNQGNTGTCWAHAAIEAVESAVRPKIKPVYSVKHMVKYVKKYQDVSDGGTHTMSMAYLLSWHGPVLKSDENNKNAKVQKHIQSAQIISNHNKEDIKRLVYKYGGVTASLYVSNKNMLVKDKYYNPAHYAYYGKKENLTNHTVLIVGWDDNFSRNNFSTKPKHNGAYICQNSWGKDYNQKGFFYLSYYDKSLDDDNVCYTQVESPNNYKHIYQSDKFGCTSVESLNDSSTVYFGNVYVSKRNEKLKAVGFYSTEENLNYEIYVTDNYTGKKSLVKDGQCDAKGNFTNEGYYTVKLPRARQLKAGQKFSVTVKVVSQEDESYLIPIEKSYKGLKIKVNTKDGKGYFSDDARSWSRAEKHKFNVCVKAYTGN